MNQISITMQSLICATRLGQFFHQVRYVTWFQPQDASLRNSQFDPKHRILKYACTYLLKYDDLRWLDDITSMLWISNIWYFIKKSMLCAQFFTFDGKCIIPIKFWHRFVNVIGPFRVKIIFANFRRIGCKFSRVILKIVTRNNSLEPASFFNLPEIVTERRSAHYQFVENYISLLW